ncbi:hypothetical protein ABZ763_14690 [Streptomyces bacillaris]|uniref:hypothetical protein n=1 Tax=Streptomyces bacillaris TaxID=68179 RepID=UPI00345F53B6
MLLVEDDADLRFGVAAALRAAGLAVDEAVDLPQADGALFITAYDCVVFDRMLPSGDAAPVRGLSNVQGNRTCGIDQRPGDAFLDRLAAACGITPPREHGLDTVGTIEAMRRGEVKVFVAMGGNFAMAAPDTPVTFEPRSGRHHEYGEGRQPPQSEGLSGDPVRHSAGLRGRVHAGNERAVRAGRPQHAERPADHEACEGDDRARRLSGAHRPSGTHRVRGAHSAPSGAQHTRPGAVSEECSFTDR